MTPVDLIKESTKYAGEALKAFSKSKSGDIAQACSLFRMQIFFGDKAWEKLSAAQQVELYKRNLAKSYIDSMQRAKGAFRQYCPGSELLNGKSSILAMPPGPGIPLSASEPERANVTAECTPDSSLRCQLEALEKRQAVIPPWPTIQELQPFRPATSASETKLALPSAPQQLRYDQSLDELVRQGLVSPEERQRIRTGATGTLQQSPAHQQACRSGALSEEECNSGVVVRWRGNNNTVNQAPPLQRPGDPQALLQSPVGVGLPSLTPTIKPLSSREKALLQRIRSGGQAPQWRTYGQCNYDWAGWKMQSNTIRTTSTYCGDTSKRWTVGVSCDRLLVAVHTTESGWSDWKRPAGPDNKTRQGEDKMVAALCANAGASLR
jgi:hypothetical protein